MIYCIYDMENLDENEDFKEADREWLRKERERHEQKIVNEVTTLRVKTKTRDLLSKICTKGMSFNEAIILLLNFYHKREKDVE